ncbi:hypothetical protein O181_083638 [Austropuccinia psidii MF-1]|uniref:Uncharacterized protein n=1 Tax=Austropuccinia psidii MF-1 TaxID=1389203 RepID=A0A9Q3IJR5_9BASI|nr:hypothetical protein [Austropuccinia psidii MF-1]
MDITLELETRYHEGQKEKGSHQEKKPPTSGFNFSKPPQSSSSKKPYHRKNKKGKNLQVSKDKPHAALLNKDNKFIGSEKEQRIKEGLCNYYGESTHLKNTSGGLKIGRDSSGNTSTSNDFSTAVNSVGLVGELKTPSLPPSVHMPSIIPSQSLLPSRDEVFKEIKDVGEDVAICSLHLFQGVIDLPHSSRHDSLEEQWD